MQKCPTLETFLLAYDYIDDDKLSAIALPVAIDIAEKIFSAGPSIIVEKLNDIILRDDVSEKNKKKCREIISGTFLIKHYQLFENQIFC